MDHPARSLTVFCLPGESERWGVWEFNNNWKQSNRVECVGEEVEEMCTAKVLRLNVELQLHISEAVKGCRKPCLQSICSPTFPCFAPIVSAAEWLLETGRE